MLLVPNRMMNGKDELNKRKHALLEGKKIGEIIYTDEGMALLQSSLKYCILGVRSSIICSTLHMFPEGLGLFT